MSRLVKSLKQTARELDAAREKRNRLIARAAAEGMSRREIAKAVGLSHQRVQQIIDDERLGN